MTKSASDPQAAGQLDLTPRDLPQRSAGRRWIPRLLVVAIAAALIGVVALTLGDASLSFKNVDAAVAERPDLGEKRFLLQGTPLRRAVPVVLGDQDAVSFTVAFEGVEADVVHVGAPAELFQPSVPVILEGRWVPHDDQTADIASASGDDFYFESSRMLVKHDNEYRVDNADRLEDAERGGMLQTES